MRILMLSWEYPPHVVGGLAAHVQGLARALAARGNEVTVITQDASTKEIEDDRGVRIVRTPAVPVRSPDFMGYVHQLNQLILGKAIEEWNDGRRYDVIHAHDWIVAFAAGTLKRSLRLPLLCTIHATEWGRNNGLHNDQQRHISDIEWWLIFESWRAIVCSEAMRHELGHVFQAPADKLRVIRNAIDIEGVQAPRDMELRRRFAADEDQVVLFVGRLVFEKGVDLLLYALSWILQSRPNVQAIIAGRGAIQGELEGLAHHLGIGHRVHFVGHVDAEMRNRLFAISDLAVFPSRYEPFGMVALEAMAAGVPVVAGAAGGLAEIITHGETGALFHPGDAGALSAEMYSLLDNREYAQRVVANAAKMVKESYSWDSVAEQTEKIYREVVDEYVRSDWGVVSLERREPELVGNHRRNGGTDDRARYGEGRYYATGLSDSTS